MSSGEIRPGFETGEFLNTSFEFFDLLLELGCLCGVDSSELVFEPLKSRFFDLFVDIGLADVLTFVDLVEIRFREVGDFECLVDFRGVDGAWFTFLGGRSVGTVAERDTGNVAWVIVFFGVTTLPEGLWAVLFVGAWLGLPTAIYLDTRTLAPYTEWPKYRWLYIVSSLVWVVAVVPGLLYLWRRRSAIDARN